MKKNIGLLATVTLVLFVAGMICSVERSAAADAEATVQLMKPQTDTDPFLKLLGKRTSTRTYTNQPLPPQTLSNLLWAAFGFSRADSGKRTAPTANNKQEIDIYAVMEKGIYLYDAKANQLKLVASGDHRAAAGTQAYVKDVPLNLIYVADMTKSGGKTDEIKLLYAGGGYGLHQRKRLPLLRLGGPRHGRPRLCGQGGAGADHEAQARPDDHPRPDGGFREIGKPDLPPAFCPEPDDAKRAGSGGACIGIVREAR